MNTGPKMGKIHRLPLALANQIAAGEVVERPASVVKELVENAIDAGARRIRIHVELGGKRQVRVEDDGDGMDPDDARLALERHATSKIATSDDLVAIVTHGFRGEALPSIASVSRCVLRTRTKGRAAGFEIRIEGGVVASEAEVAAAEGTVVEVNDLFYNLPARRKFLKSDSAEAAQVSRVATQMALAYPRVGWTVTSASRTVASWAPVETLEARLFQVYGERSDLLPVHRSVGGLTVSGYVATLAEQGPRRGVQNIYVNHRIVKDRTIAHAILDAYSQGSIRERSPEAHLFLDMPPDAVDVNVHPTKAEVRFREPSFVHEVVKRAIVEALGAGGVPQLTAAPDHDAYGSRAPSLGRESGFASAYPYPVAAGAPGVWTGIQAKPGLGWGRAVLSPVPFGGVAMERLPELGDRLVPLGQFRDTFIVAIDEDGVTIVDQHVAHERVLFERVMEQLATGRLASQRLLVPLVLELAPAAFETVMLRRVEIERLGFEVDRFGERSVQVTALPALLGRDEGERTLLALADDLERLDCGSDVQVALQRIAATTACHAAVKANAPLTLETMRHILGELAFTAHSTVCPHGRPVMLRLSRREIERRFERV